MPLIMPRTQLTVVAGIAAPGASKWRQRRPAAAAACVPWSVPGPQQLQPGGPGREPVGGRQALAAPARPPSAASHLSGAADKR